jgi:hypothetical protein
MHDLFNEDITFTSSEKKQAADNFTDTRLWGIGAVTWFGISYQQEKIGGFAFSIRDRGLWKSILNDQAAQFIFMGYNAPFFDVHVYDPDSDYDTIGYTSKPFEETSASIVYKGTDLGFIWYREYNFGYGRMVIDKDDITWYMGIGLKYLVGYAGTQYYQDKNDKLVGFSSFSPLFEVDYGVPSINPDTSGGLKKVGNGFGFDIGTTVKYKDLKVSVALNDIGSIKWKKNVFEGNDVHVYSIETPGIDNYNIFSQGQLIVADNAPEDPNQWTPLDSKKVKIPMNLRTGASYRFSEKIEAGADLYVPLGQQVPGRYDKAVFGIGGTFNPAKWVQLNIGLVTGGKFGTNIPFGVSFFPVNTDETTWQLGFAVRDIITLFKQDKPTVSLAFGFLRFSFGHKETSTRYLDK